MPSFDNRHAAEQALMADFDGHRRKFEAEKIATEAVRQLIISQ
jgi:hypothetical protein